MSIFTGSGVALITPFHADQSVDYDKLDELLNYHCSNCTDSIIVCGTSGECATLSEEEHSQVIKFAVQQVKGRIPVIAGTGSNSTQTAIELSRQAQEHGADGLLLVSPYYNKGTQKGLISHYTAIAAEVSCPIILYNVASRTGINIQPETIAELYQRVDNITAVKEASGDISQVADIMHLTDGKIDLYSGNDDQIVPILSLGGKGVISVLANIAPAYIHTICEEFFKGNVAESCRMQLDALPLIKALFCEVNPIPVKKALYLMGLNSEILRLPLTELTSEHTAQLADRMQAFGIAIQ